MRDVPPLTQADQTSGCGPLLRASRELGRSLRQEVFEYVRSRGQAARADITHALDISAGSATTLTAELIAMGHLREVEGPLRETGRGRPKIALEVVPEAAFVIGIKLAFKRHTAVLTDFAGTVVAQTSLPSAEVRRPLADLLAETHALVEALLIQAGNTTNDIRAVGIGLPGIIDHASGRVAWSSLLQTQDEYMAQAFEARVGIPVVIDNDANMLTLAELWFGQGRAMADFAVVTIESGVGMGMVHGNQLYRGANGMGLELGHTKVQLDGALCKCGQRGCLEAYVADYALSREAATALDHAFAYDEAPQDVLDVLFHNAKAGHVAAEAIFRRAGRFLSLGLSNVVQLFDPALIILSGARMQYDYFYATEVLNEMHTMTLNAGRQPCKVAINAWGDLVWARGASALALADATDRLVGAEARSA